MLRILFSIVALYQTINAINKYIVRVLLRLQGVKFSKKYLLKAF